MQELQFESLRNSQEIDSEPKNDGALLHERTDIKHNELIC